MYLLNAHLNLNGIACYFYGITKITSSSFPVSIFQEQVIFHQTFDLSICANWLDARALKHVNKSPSFPVQLQFLWLWLPHLQQKQKCVDFLNSQEVDRQGGSIFIEHSPGGDHLGLYKITQRAASQVQDNCYQCVACGSCIDCIELKESILSCQILCQVLTLQLASS